MAVNKVVYGTNTLIDISDTTATAEDVAVGKVFYLANGVPATGTFDQSELLQSKTIAPTESIQTVIPDEGYEGLSSVTIEAVSPAYVGTSIIRHPGSTITPTKSEQTLITNGKYMTGDITVEPIPDDYITVNDSTATPEDVAVGKVFYLKTGVRAVGTLTGDTIVTGDEATVDGKTLIIRESGEITLQSKEATPTNSAQTITPDEGYDGLSQVTVNPIPSEYIIPSGSTTVSSNGTVDVTAYSSAVINVQPTLQSKTANPTESSQVIAPDLNYEGLSSVTVSAISPTYIGSGITQQAGSTITPSTSSQTVSTSGKYMTGDITVEPIPSNYITTSDATATANDILSGETAYVNGSKLTGTLEVHYYYTGSSDPSSSTGSNGDLYLKVSN